MKLDFLALTYSIWGITILLSMVICLLDVLKNQGDEPQRTSLWFALLFGFPLFGVILYLVAGRSSKGGMGRRVKDSADNFFKKIKQHERLDAYYASLLPYIIHTPAMPTPALDRMMPETCTVTGNAVRLLRDGTAAYPAMLEAMNAAKKTILLQSFIIADDEIGHYILKTLEDKARDGVHVKILYDSFGSFFSAFYRMFNRYGRGIPNFQIRPFSFLNSFTRWRFQMRNHRKLLVVDGCIAFLGGVNISEDNVPKRHKGDSAIHDLHCRIVGPVVGELEMSFLRDWFYATGESEEKLVAEALLPPVKSEGDCLVRVITSGWGQCYEGSERTFHTAVSTARKSLWIISPYFVPDTPFIMALRMAVARGVDVRVVVPMNNNHFYVKMASRSFYETLLDEGVRIFERKGVFVHAKAMLVDSEWAMIGSSNCDVRSFRLNFELDTVIHGKDFIEDLKKEFLSEFQASDEITSDDIDSKQWITRAMENLCALLTPLL